MNAPVALLVVLLSQLAFWALLRAGFFLTALGANVVFWCAAFPAWTEAGRRRWKTSVTPDVALVLMLIALTVCAFLAAANELTETGVAWGWVGLFNVPVSLIAATLATLRASRRASGADGLKPMTAVIITAVVLALALAGVAILIFSTGIGPS
jgi:cytochrome bd-type quinol oxidase subunit 2